jgi:hypothetical protein
MPPRDDDPAAPSPLRDLFDEMMGSAVDFLRERAADVAPRCCLCDEFALPVRCSCGHFACKDHGFFNIIEARVICACCAARLGAMPGYDGYEYQQQARRAARKAESTARSQRQAQHARRKARQGAGRGSRRPPAAQDVPTIDPALAFELLGLDPATATEQSISKAFRVLAMECHPDLHPGDPTAAKRFKGLSAAKAACLAHLQAKAGFKGD